MSLRLKKSRLKTNAVDLGILWSFSVIFWNANYCSMQCSFFLKIFLKETTPVLFRNEFYLNTYFNNILQFKGWHYTCGFLLKIRAKINLFVVYLWHCTCVIHLSKHVFIRKANNDDNRPYNLSQHLNGAYNDSFVSKSKLQIWVAI